MITYKQQVGQLDCGISVVQIMHKYFFDKWLNIKEIKEKAKYNNLGISIQDLKNLFLNFGIKAKTLSGGWENFIKIKITKPVVSIIKNNDFLHYIVIEKITNKKNIIYIDPILGKIKISLNEFKSKFTGIIILCKKNNVKNDKKNIYKNETTEEINMFSKIFLIEKFVVFFSSIFVLIGTFVLSLYLKIILDQIFIVNQIQELLLISLLFILLLTLKTFLDTINNFFIHKIEIKIQSIFFKKYIDKLSDVNLLLIKDMHEADHLKNIEIISKIASFNSGYLINLMSNLISLIISSFFLIFLNVKIMFLSIFLASLSFVVTYLSKSKFKYLSFQILDNSNLFRKNFLTLIKLMNQFKLNKVDNIILKQIKDTKENLISNENNFSMFYSIYNLTQILIKQISPFLIVVLSVFDVWKNNLSLGQIFFFLSLFNLFVNPFSYLINVYSNVSILKNELSNLNYFLSLKSEINQIKNRKNIYKIEKIEIKHLNFSFGDKKIFQIKNLLINNKLKIVGKNGSGKSTLMNIISTLYLNNNVYYNDLNVDVINLESLRNQICYINSNNIFPECSIYEFILNNKKENINFFIEKYNKYNLSKLFEKMNIALEDKILNNGENLSISQKQFIALMKIFSNDYSVVLLDEVFENLDKEIKNNLIEIFKEDLKRKIVLEISHGNNYIFSGKEINCEEFNK